jgi:hypothetical protein
MSDSFYAVDSDLRPVRLYPVTRAVGESFITWGVAYALMPVSQYALTWATRFGETRWYVFPREG